MTIAAIPTKYKGVQFRSRLEARWAAFFDLLGWKWEYEPEDLAGWIPDFVLPEIFQGGSVLVEVKPSTGLDELATGAVAKYERAGDQRMCLILGLGPFFDNHICFIGHAVNQPTTVMLGENEDKPFVVDFCDRVALVAEDGGPFIYANFEGCLQYLNGDPRLELQLTRKWSHAGSLTQWRGVGARP